MPNTDTVMVLVSSEDYVKIREIPLFEMKTQMFQYEKSHYGYDAKKLMRISDFLNYCQHVLGDFIKIFLSKSDEVIIEIKDKEQKEFSSHLEACKYIKEEFKGKMEFDIFCKDDLIRTKSDEELFRQNFHYATVEKKISDLMDSE